GDPAIAGDGYGIAALCVGAYRGWISESDAYHRILNLLKAYESFHPRNSKGYYWQWHNMDDYPDYKGYGPESDIDNPWLVCGMILAAEYFKGTEVADTANAIYDSMKFNEQGCPSGYCEYLIIPIVGGGSAHPWSDDTLSNAWAGIINSVDRFGPLFYYQWPGNYVDFRYIRNRYNDYSEFDTCRDAILWHRDKCDRLHDNDPDNYKDYGPNCWGLTAATASPDTSGGDNRYLAMKPWPDGDENYWTDSGSVVPICLPACMTHVPSEARAAMKYIYNTYPQYFGKYTFWNNFNTGNAYSGSPFEWPVNASMDYGANVLELENFRSGMPWKYFMRNSRIQEGLRKCGFYTAHSIPRVENFDQVVTTNVWGGTNGSSSEQATITLVDIDPYNEWVKGKALRMTATGSNQILRVGLNETDQSSKDLLSFWIRAETTNLQVAIGLQDAEPSEPHEVAVPITDYLEGDSVPTNWTRVRIPMYRFATGNGALYDIRLIFLGDFSVHFNGAGTVWLDDLAFVSDDRPAPAPPTRVGAACDEGRVRIRFTPNTDYGEFLGCSIWRRDSLTSGFERGGSHAIAFSSEGVDDTLPTAATGTYYYALQSFNRNGIAGAFSGGEDETCVEVGPFRALDWSDGRAPNTFGGGDGGWGAGWSMTYERQSNHAGQTGWVRHAIGDAADCGFYTSLQGQSLADYNLFEGWIRGTQGGEQVRIGLRSTDGEQIKRDVSAYLPDGMITTNWSLLRIPLSDFRGVDISDLENLSFTFDQAGDVFLDRLAFCRIEFTDHWSVFREAEHPDGFSGGNNTDFKYHASNQCTLGGGWGMDYGHWVDYIFTAPGDLGTAYVDVQYACDSTNADGYLRVKINDAVVGTWQPSQTFGWGDRKGTLWNKTIRLGYIPAGPFKLTFEVATGGRPVNLDKLSVWTGRDYYREMEHYDAQYGSSGTDDKLHASQGQVLGNSWGAEAGDEAVYSNIVFRSPLTNALLRLCYAQNTEPGARVRVYWNNVDMGLLLLPPTGGWLDYYAADSTVANFPLGTLPEGTNVLKFVALEGSCAVNLDWFQIAASSSANQMSDRDGDGIPDEAEALYGTSPLLADSDADGIDDLDEVTRNGGGYLTDPLSSDSDQDEFSDGDELIACTDPTDPLSVFQLQTIAHTETNGGAFQLQWMGSPAGHYRVDYLDNPTGEGDVFIPITDPERITPVSSNCVGYLDDGSGTGSLPLSPANTRIYRIRAVK
ncbi:MAG: glucoamylase family protein, partial [Kiritimatiellae bacterium]|nr:glucoamylase family protein [Kiritimatiellia bacterium]